MTERSLQVTYRKGRPFAAYLHLSHPTGEKSVKTKPSPDGLLVVDYGVTGRPVGIEITAPLAVPLQRLNQLLADLGQAPLTERDYKPVRAGWVRLTQQDFVNDLVGLDAFLATHHGRHTSGCDASGLRVRVGTRHPERFLIR